MDTNGKGPRIPVARSQSQKTANVTKDSGPMLVISMVYNRKIDATIVDRLLLVMIGDPFFGRNVANTFAILAF